MKGTHSRYEKLLYVQCFKLYFFVVKDFVITFSSSFLFRPLVLLFPEIQSVSVEISTETTR